MKKATILLGALLIGATTFAQTFEPEPLSNDFDKVKVRVGADFAMQYQSLNHSADSLLIPL